MTDRVMVSYSRRDSGAVLPAARRLEQDGLSVWIDQSSIPVSVPWFDEIIQAIRGAVLVVFCETLDWHSSMSCRTERELAEQLRKPVLYVDPYTQSADEIGHLVARKLAEVPAQERVRAELLSRSFRWSRAGKHRGDLASRKQLRTYRRLPDAATDQWARTFVGRSRRKAVRRRIAQISTVVVTIAAVLIVGAVNKAGEQITDQLAAVGDHLVVDLQAQTAINSGPYAGLAAVSAFPESDDVADFFNRRSITALALAQNVPSAYEPAPPTTGAPSTTATAGRNVATVEPPAVLRIHSADADRTLSFAGSITGLAWSPDGLKIAVADAGGVELVDARQGHVFATLRGVPSVVAVSWPAAAKVQARTVDGHLATWALETATTAVDAKWWFIDMARAPNGDLAALSRTGQLVSIGADGSSTKMIVDLEGHSPVALAAGPSGWLIATGDAPTQLIQVADDRSMTSTDLGTCSPTGVAWSTAMTAAVVVCSDSSYLIWTPTGGKPVRYTTELVNGTAVLADGDLVLVAGGVDELMRVTPTGPAPITGTSSLSCAYGFRRLISVPNQGVFGVGAGFSDGCARRMKIGTGPAADVDHLAVLSTTASEARGLAVNSSGTLVAIGDSSGTVSVIDPDSFAVLQISRITGSEIRGLAFVDNDAAVVAITRDGEVLRVPLTQAHMTIGQARTMAQQQLAQARSWGLA